MIRGWFYFKQQAVDKAEIVGFSLQGDPEFVGEVCRLYIYLRGSAAHGITLDNWEDISATLIGMEVDQDFLENAKKCWENMSK